MSVQPPQPPKMEVVSESKRAEIAKRLAEGFNSLDPEGKRKFVDDTLTVLVNMSKRQMQKLFSSFIKRGKPSTKDLETINQLVIVFLWSVKEEFRYLYASMIYKSLGIPLPEDLPQKLQEVRELKFIHAGVSPEVYDKLFGLWQKWNINSFDEFFNHVASEIKT